MQTVRELARDLVMNSTPLNSAYLISMWSALGHTVYADQNDVQIGTIHYIYVDGKQLDVWLRKFEPLLSFVSETLKQRGCTPQYSETLRHDIGEVSGTLMFRSRVDRQHSFHYRSRNVNIEDARFTALFHVFAQALLEI